MLRRSILVFGLPARAALAASVLGCASAAAGQIDTATFIMLQRGMGVGEILVRAGPPDLVSSSGDESVEVVAGSVDGDGDFDVIRRTRERTVEEWHYIPGPGEHDPYLTVITFKRGTVWTLERTKIFSRAPRAAPAQAERAPSEPRPSDHELRVRRIDRTLDAAESYAETRARLKERAEATGPGRPPDAVYSGTDPDGTAYFGDLPPGEQRRSIIAD